MLSKNAKITLLDATKINSFYGANNNIIVLNETPSTNDYGKNLMLNGSDCVTVLSESQTNGKGRFDRSFYSPKNDGVYMSFCFKPNLNIEYAPKITSFVSVIVARAIEKLAKVTVKIKWVNDLFIMSKKVCGILTESSIDYKNNKINYVIVGIGIDVTGKYFPKKLAKIATSIEKESGKVIDRNKLIAEILNGFKDFEAQILSGKYFGEYKARSNILNKQIVVSSLTETFEATAVDILDNGALLVKKGEELITLTVGDVSVKPCN